MGTTVGALAELVGGTAQGDSELIITDVADLRSAGPQHISFLSSLKYLPQFRRTKAAAVLVQELIDAAHCTLILCSNPYLAMARIAQLLHAPATAEPGIQPGAHVHPSASIDPSASVHMGAVVQAEASVGPRVVVGSGCVVGTQARIGADCILHPGSKVLDRCVLGNRVILQAGAIIGSDGFGYAPDGEGRRHKIPQVGIVELQDDVEVGANSTVDRATFGTTRLGAGTKIDNLVQIAHNVEMGENCVVVSQSGIAGSTILGDRVIMGAQSGIVGHVHIASDVMLGARSGVPHTLPQAGVYSGAPCMPHRQWLKMALVQQSLPALRRRVRELEGQLAKLDPA